MEKEKLEKILSALKPGIASREIIEEMTHFTFTGDRVLTYNEEVCVSHPLQTDFGCSVSAQDMLDGLKKAKDEKVKLEMVDKTLCLTSKDQDVEMYTSQDEEIKNRALAVVTDATNDDWLPVPEDFTDCMFLTMFSASTQEVDGSLQGICVVEDKTYSCDRLRMTRCTMKAPMKSFTIRAPVAKDLRKYSLKQYNTSPNWINFRTEDDVIFSVKVLAEEYPYKDLETQFDLQGLRLTLPDSLQEAAQDLITWTEGELDFHKTISVLIDNNMMLVEGKKDSGLMRKRIITEYQGDPVKFLISPVYLSAILEKGVTRMIVGEKRAAFRKSNMIHLMQLQAQ